MRAMKTEHGLLWLTEIQYLESNFNGSKLKTKTYMFHLHFKISLSVEKKPIYMYNPVQVASWDHCWRFGLHQRA